MPSTMEVYFLPELATAQSLAGKTVVVIDVLRATTSIVHALAAGAASVAVCETVEEARNLAAGLSGAVLGGERQGVRIEGFDLGNSPLEFNASVVRGKTVIFTTTNGTRALRKAQLAGRLLIGAFVNLSAVCHAVAGADSLALLCAGTNGEVTREDVLLAGAIVVELTREQGGSEAKANDQAWIAADAWREAERGLKGARPLAETLRRSRGGANLIELGMERDISIAAEVDRFDLAPEVSTSDWRVRVLPRTG